MPTLSRYLALLPAQHANRLRFVASLSEVLQPLVEGADAAATLPPAFDLDSAIGVQLDRVGEWVGRPRTVEQPLAGVYFSLDTPLLGFDQGSWKGPFDPDSGLVLLDDESYRQLLRAKIAANQWHGDLPYASIALSAIDWGAGATLFIQDGQNMTMFICLSGTLPSAVLRALLAGQYVPLKPAGVELSTLITSVDGAPIFGFNINDPRGGGFDVGAFATIYT